MNYGRKETKQKIKAASSRKKKYANWVFLSFFKTVLVLFLFVAVTGISMGIGMFRGILDSSPGFNPDSFAPSGYFSTIYNSAGEVTDTLVGSNANRIEASYEEFPQDLIDAFVSIEDTRFWQHNGIDFRSITRAAVGVLTNNYSGLQRRYGDQQGREAGAENTGAVPGAAAYKKRGSQDHSHELLKHDQSGQ